MTVYLNAWCPHSRRARSLLARQQIPFTDVNFEQDREAAQRVKEWNHGYLSSPTIIIRLVLTEPLIRELERIFTYSGAAVLALTAYKTDWCPTSRRTLNWLTEHRVPFQAVNIEQDRTAARQVQLWNQGNLSVPTLDITLRVTEPTSDQLLAALDLHEQPF